MVRTLAEANTFLCPSSPSRHRSARDSDSQQSSGGTQGGFVYVQPSIRRPKCARSERRTAERGRGARALDGTTGGDRAPRGVSRVARVEVRPNERVHSARGVPPRDSSPTSVHGPCGEHRGERGEGMQVTTPKRISDARSKTRLDRAGRLLQCNRQLTSGERYWKEVAR